MGDFLLGKELSGTPIETRGGTEAIAGDILGGGRLQQQAASGALGFDVGGLGLESAVQRLLSDPTDRLRGLFAALEPFEERQRDEAVAGTRGSFGRLGGRFSRNLLEVEGRTRGEVAGQQSLVRQQGILEVGNQQSQVLGLILQSLLGARGQTLDFFRPGAPGFQPGALGDLLGAAGIIGASQIGGGGGATASAARPPRGRGAALGG